jgi:lipoprotein-releasing system ATP-binding protein
VVEYINNQNPTDTAKEILIRAEKLTRVIPAEIPVTLVKDVTINITASQFVVITGPSGSGKSSLLYLLGLLDTPTSGKLWIGNKDTSLLTPEELAYLRLSQIGFVFQFHFLLPEFSALENVMLPMQKLGKLSKNEQIEKAKTLLAQFGLGDHFHKLPKQLSGGQSQRVAIARSLANDPQYILADEPTGNLDSKSTETVRQILRSLVSKEKRTVITVTHDLHFAENPDLLIHIVDGQVVS